jgi:hypothetical protein
MASKCIVAHDRRPEARFYRLGETPPYGARYMLRYAIPLGSLFLFFVYISLSIRSPIILPISKLAAKWGCRPETVESLFIAFRLTGDKRYRDHGWAIFQAIEKHCRIPSGGYATIVNVDEVPVRHEDKMETFFLVSFFLLIFLSSSGLGN